MLQYQEERGQIMKFKTNKSDQTPAHEERPWEKQFVSDRDDSGRLSRVQVQRRRKNSTLFVSILVVLLLITFSIPLAYAWIDQHNENSTQFQVSNTATSQSSTAASKAKTAKTSKNRSSQKASTSSATSSSVAQSKSTTTSTTSSRTASSSQTTSQSQSTSAASSSTTSSTSSTNNDNSARYYTVKAGDNLYRIAVNHGLTLAELLELNGLSSGANITSGQQLRIK